MQAIIDNITNNWSKLITEARIEMPSIDDR